MNRRDFLKQALLGGIGLSLPLELGASLTIVDIKILDSFRDIMKFGGTRFENGQAFMDVSVDTKAIWQHVRLIDDENREWITYDEGETWHCDLMEFSLEYPTD